MDTAAELENARALYRIGRHKRAAEICQRILERQPSRPDALLVLAMIADDLGDSRAAIGFLTRIVDRHPRHPGAAALLADLLGKMGAAEGAIAWYRVALEAGDDARRVLPALARLLAAAGNADAIAQLALERLDQNHADLAIEAARTGRERAPRHAGLAFAEGRALLAAGRRDEARQPLRMAVATGVGDAEALGALGQATVAPCWLRRALAVAPTDDLRVDLGEVLAELGQVADAERMLEQALAADRAHGRALGALARLKLARGDVEAAIGFARRRLSDDPEDAATARLLGTALARRGLAASALTYAQTAARAGRSEVARAVAEGIVADRPEHLDAWRAVGTARAVRVVLAWEPTDAAAMRALASLDGGSPALAWLERAIRLDQSTATILALGRALASTGAKEAAHRLIAPVLASIDTVGPAETAVLARLLVDIGESKSAASLLEALTARAPDDVELADALIEANATLGDTVALVRIGQAHLAKRRPQQAARAFAAARRHRSDSAQVAFLHGRALWEAEEKTAAVDAFADAAETAGDENLDLVTRAGEALVGLQASDLGLRYLRRAVDLDFTNPDRHSYSFFFNFLNQCDWPARSDYVKRLTDLGEARIAADDPTFRLNPSLWVFLGAERDLLYRSANHFARHTFASSPSNPDRPGGDPDRPIRLGYLSGFLHGHHIGYSLLGLVQAHDRNEVQVHLYGRTNDDEIQAALKRQAHVFRSIDGKSPAAIAQMIGADGIDVLVDLDGYVNSASGLVTLQVASRRAAPIQMLYHNYVGPTGTDFVDYVVADRELLDAADDVGYRERLLRIPPCYYPAAPLPTADIRTERRSWGLPEQGVVFCNFGHFYKVEPSCFDSWMRIMRRVPGSALWLNHWDTPAAVANLRREAEARGVEPGRLVFSALADKSVHLARLGLADIFLDTFVYASGVTSLDVLWGGVPVLTIRGSTFARRVGASLNAGIGLDDLTCAGPDDYEELAVALATDPQRLAEVKSRLRAHLPTHPLFDQARLARDLERAYRAAFRRQASGLAPETMEIPRLGQAKPAG